MGHPHLQRLKTKLIESNERLEESNRCIVSLRAQYASLEDESTESIASLRAHYASLEGEFRDNIASLRAQNANDNAEEIRWLRGVEEENKEEIRLLRARVEEVMGNVTTLKRDNARRTRVEYNTKRSVLRSFK